MNKFLKDCGCEEVGDCMDRKCVECDIPAVERNNYFCGKLMVERDFWCDQEYHMGKLRRHNKLAHGWGTLCGLKVVQHPKEECRDKYIVLKPGVAYDCCGREIIVKEEQLIKLPGKIEEKDYTAEMKATVSLLFVAIHYRECFTEPVPSLYSECECDDRCEPNRIRELFEVKLFTPDELKDIQPAYHIPEDEESCDISGEIIEECPDCPPKPPDHWVVLASVEYYVPGVDVVTDNEIDNFTYRRLVPGTDLLYRMILCLMEKGVGEKGDPGKDGVDGIGLDKELPKIKEIIPAHKGIIRLNNFTSGEIKVKFDRPMEPSTIDKNTFVVSMEYPEKRRGIYTTPGIMANSITLSSNGKVATFKPVDQFLNQTLPPILEEYGKITFRVILKGDFILDEKDKLPLDGNHLNRDIDDGTPKAGLPSGDWVPGGYFESWFEITLEG